MSRIDIKLTQRVAAWMSSLVNSRASRNDEGKNNFAPGASRVPAQDQGPVQMLAGSLG